jgi:riboflavin biosynthesis pyrimidine reductase
MSRQSISTPIQTLFEGSAGRALRLPPRLARLYGQLKLPARGRRPYLFSNFVTTLDGVVSLQQAGHLGGSDISGHNLQDRMVMGVLRAVADVVMIGSGTLAADPSHVWTADGICPELADDYRRLRDTLRNPATPLNVVVSGSGDIDLGLPVFASGRVRTLVLTSSAGAKRLSKRAPSSATQILAIQSSGAVISPAAILRAIGTLPIGHRILLEGGPRLLGEFYERRLVDEQFLTLSPQVLGRASGDQRLSLVMDQLFAPGKGRWGRLTGVKRGASHLFLRYTFGQDAV